MQQKDRNPRLAIYFSPDDMDRIKAVSGLNGMACFARTAIMHAVEQAEKNATKPARRITEKPATDAKPWYETCGWAFFADEAERFQIDTGRMSASDYEEIYAAHEGRDAFWQHHYKAKQYASYIDALTLWRDKAK